MEPARTQDGSSRDPGERRAVPAAEAGPAPAIVILGVGNLLLSDEGFGVHAAEMLAREAFGPGVSVVEGGTDGFGLFHVIREADHLIVVDAIRGGGTPGSIYRFERGAAPGGRLPPLHSAHQVGILEVLELAELIGGAPAAVFLGVEPGSLEIGLELSPAVAARLPRVVELVHAEVARLRRPTRSGTRECRPRDRARERPRGGGSGSSPDGTGP